MNKFSRFDELSPMIDIPKELTKVNSINKTYKNIIGALALIIIVGLIYYYNKTNNDEKLQ